MHDLRPQAAPVLERGAHAGPRQLLEVRARRARLDPPQHDVADPERLADEMEQRNTLGDEVAARLVLAELDARLRR